MQLKKLSIFKTNGNIDALEITGVVREVSFKDGLNIITDDGIDKGNTVGKTTFLQLIDLCLGAQNIDSIYKDSNAKSDINPIKTFIEQHFVAISLTFDSKTIVRPLFLNNKIKLDSDVLGLNDFNKIMRSYFFDETCDKPSFRQLIPKFIRITPDSIENMLNFCAPFTKSSDKLIIKRTLFGYPDMKNAQIRQNIDARIKALEQTYGKKIRTIKPKKLEQEINVVKVEIEKLNKERESINLAEDINKLVENSSELYSEYTEIKNQLDTINFIIASTEHSLLLLKSRKSNIDTSILNRLYSEASSLLNSSQLPKTFDELVKFHNISVEKETLFIQKRYKELLQEKENIQQKLHILSEKKISLQLANKFNSIAEKLATFNQDLGKNLELHEQFQHYESSLRALENELEKYPDSKDNNKIFDKNLTEFNLIFSDIYFKMFNKQASRMYADDKAGVRIESDKEKSGTGEKIGEVVAFDLAYMSFSHQAGIKCPRFQIQDRLEMTDANPKIVAFQQILPKTNCQYIIATLNSSILNSLGEEFIRNNTILSLSQNDKLFRI